MNNLSKIENHAEQAFDRLLQQFQDGGTFGLLVEKIATRYQSLEDVLYSLIEARYLENATGATLEEIGDLVGETKTAGLTDDQFRVRIYGRIAANISTGTLENIIAVLGALKAREIRIFQRPAGLTVNYINGSATLTCGCIRSILEQAKLSVSLDITEHDDLAFGFDGDNTAAGFDGGLMGENQ